MENKTKESLDSMKKYVKDMIDVLKFYANEDNYDDNGAPFTEQYVAHGGECERLDLGYKAQEVLKSIGYNKCSKCGKINSDVMFGPDPYFVDTCNDETPVWMCEDCRADNALEV